MAVLPEVEANVRLNRGDASAINLPRVKETGIEAMAGLVKDVADASFQIVQQRQAATMLREISDMKLRQDAAMQDLALNTAPGADVVKPGIEGFVKEANDFIARQPSYLRDGAREKMLMLRDNAASNLLGLQAKLDSEQIALDTEKFSNNILNDVRYGNLDETSAIIMSNEYADAALPPRVREKVKEEMRSGVRIMSLASLAEKSPEKAKSLIQSGKYNDLDPNKLDSIFNAAESRIEKKRNEGLVLQNKVMQARLDGKPLEAARLSFALEGKVDVTNDDLIRKQREMGFLDTQLEIIDRDQAKFIGDAIRAADNEADRIAIFNQAIAEQPTEYEQGIAKRNIMQHGEIPVEMEMIVDNVNVSGREAQEFSTALSTLMFNPEAAVRATKEITDFSKATGANVDAANEALTKNIQRLRVIHALNESDPREVEKRLAVTMDAATIAMRNQLILNKDVSEDFVNNMFEQFGGTSSKFDFPVRKENEEIITERGSKTAIEGALVGKNIALDVDGFGAYKMRLSSPAEYDQKIKQIKNGLRLTDAGTVGVERAYYLKDGFGGDFIYEVTQVDGKQVLRKVIITETDLIKSSTQRKVSRSDGRGSQ